MTYRRPGTVGGMLRVTWDLTTPAGQIRGSAVVADLDGAAGAVWAAYRAGGHDAALSLDVALVVAELCRSGPPVEARRTLARVSLTHHQ